MCNKEIEATRGATGGTNSILDSTLNQNYDPEGPDQSQQNMGRSLVQMVGMNPGNSSDNNNISILEVGPF